jgi:hypothetical protein
MDLEVSCCYHLINTVHCQITFFQLTEMRAYLLRLFPPEHGSPLNLTCPQEVTPKRPEAVLPSSSATASSSTAKTTLSQLLRQPGGEATAESISSNAIAKVNTKVTVDKRIEDNVYADQHRDPAQSFVTNDKDMSWDMDKMDASSSEKNNKDNFFSEEFYEFQTRHGQKKDAGGNQEYSREQDYRQDYEYVEEDDKDFDDEPDDDNDHDVKEEQEEEDYVVNDGRKATSSNQMVRSVPENLGAVLNYSAGQLEDSAAVPDKDFSLVPNAVVVPHATVAAVPHKDTAVPHKDTAVPQGSSSEEDSSATKTRHVANSDVMSGKRLASAARRHEAALLPAFLFHFMLLKHFCRCCSFS